MTISGTCGNRSVDELEELLQILRSTRKGAFGEFWLGEPHGPSLAIHINGELAYLHYFPAERHPGFQAVGEQTANGMVFFTQEGDAGFSMPRAVVVSVERAYQAATDFFQSLGLPGSLEWAEL